MSKITKEKIVEMLKVQIGLSGTICEELTNIIIDEILNLTIKHNKLRLKNFGVFAINSKKARPAQNLQTGQTMPIPARNVLRFLPSKSLKEAINLIKK
ncbi:MAG: HU family DNA-binding protein [Rickettsiaceae bacterium]|nr:MAG: HU family DNA-binding protein [Rickettsiaceae bacterium]